MALTKGDNVYVDDALAAADAYFLEHIGSERWSALTNSEKTNYLVTGTSILDGLEYRGVAADLAQKLAFPREGDYFDVRLGSIVEFDGITYPSRIVTASFEMALHLSDNPDLLVNSGSVKSLDVKGIVLTDIRPTPLIPGHVKRLISPLLENNQSGWWRAN